MKQKLTDTLKIALLGAAVLGTLTGCGKKEPVQVGFVAGFSGRSSDLAVSGRDGVLLALEQWNYKGGIRGHKIELQLSDEGKQKPEELMQQLKEKKVVALIGPMTSGAAAYLLPSINEAKMLTVSPTVASGDFSEKDDWFFKVLSETRSYAERSAQYHVGNGVRDFCVIWDQGNVAYSKNWLSHFESKVKQLGATVSFNVPYVFERPEQFVELSDQVQEQKCPAVLMIAPAKDAAQLVQQLKKTNTQKVLLTSEWAATEQFLQLGGAAVEGVYMAQFMNRESKESTFLRFVEDFSKRFGRAPGFAELAGYDAANVLFSAMSQSDSVRSGANIKTQLLNPKGFEGVQQRVIFNATGDAQRASFMTQIQNGKFKVISDGK